MTSNKNGVIYYKLDVNTNGYVGDYTKNCGLKGEEIDGNFHFLRGHDIEYVSFDKENNLHLKRYDGTELIANKTETSDYNFAYDNKHGVLTVITPSSEEILLDGFCVESSVHHDFTLDGTGLQNNPLKISSLAQTGRYFPAIKLVESLPTENIAKNDRYVTKEKVNRFGKLYSSSIIKTLQERLKETNSKWRIPTKEDWDVLLNFVDCENPEHNSSLSGFYGDYAGAALKSTQYWNTVDGKLLSDDVYGFSIYPVGYTNNINNSISDKPFGTTSAFWTSTETDNGYYIKSFNYDTERVEQATGDNNCYLSIRLVKDYDSSDMSDVEIVDGASVKCLHIPGHNLIWSKENYYNITLSGFEPEEWKEYDKENNNESRFFINEWNGTSWVKQEISEGVGIVLHEGEYGRMHEWMVIDGVLTDVSEFIKPEFNNEIEALNTKLENETSRAISVEENLNSQLVSLEDELTNKFNVINNRIEDEVNTLSDNEKELRTQINENTNNISEEIFTREELINALNDEIANIKNDINKNAVKSDNNTIITEYTENGVNLEVNFDNETIYINDSGKLSVVPAEKIQYLPGDGLDLIDNVFSIKVDETTEEYLTNSSEGIKVYGVNDAITKVEQQLLNEVNSVRGELNLINDNVETNLEVAKNYTNEITTSLKTNLSTNITNVSNELNDFKTNTDNRFHEVVSNNNETNENVSQLESKIDNLITSFNSLQERLIELTSKVTVIENILNTYDVLQEKVTNLENTVSNTKDNVNKLNDTLDNKITSVYAKIDEKANSLDIKFDNKIENLHSEVIDIVKDINEVKLNVNEVKTKAIYNVVGVPNEILVGTSEDKHTVTVGFAPDALFVAG